MAKTKYKENYLLKHDIPFYVNSHHRWNKADKL